MLERYSAFQMAEDLYKHCKTVKLPDYLRSQILRASSSVALNLAEGLGKKTTPDRNKYFTNALGSLRECEAILRLEARLDENARRKLDQLGAILYKLSHKQ